MSHSPEPWSIDLGFDRHYLVDADGQILSTSLHTDLSNAERIVACVNACKGVHNDTLGVFPNVFTLILLVRRLSECLCERIGPDERKCVLADMERMLYRGEAVAGWQPIETAPKDRRPVLLAKKDCPMVWIGEWNPEYEWWNAYSWGWRTEAGKYDYWMPLPEPPAKEKP
jgi:hypothetical protein